MSMEKVGKLLSTSAVQRASRLLEYKQKLEKELKKQYDTQGWEEEYKVVKAMQTNIKAFFAYGKARQKTKAKVGPFLDPNTGIQTLIQTMLPTSSVSNTVLFSLHQGLSPWWTIWMSSSVGVWSGESSTRVDHFSRILSFQSLILRWLARS